MIGTHVLQINGHQQIVGHWRAIAGPGPDFGHRGTISGHLQLAVGAVVLT
jgi:hypothetical protein